MQAIMVDALLNALTLISFTAEHPGLCLFLLRDEERRRVQAVGQTSQHEQKETRQGQEGACSSRMDGDH